MVTLNSRKYRSFSSFFQKWVRRPQFFFNKSVTLVSRNISGKFKKNLSTQFFRIKFRLFWQFLSTISFYFSIMKSWSMYLLMYKFLGTLPSSFWKKSRFYSSRPKFFTLCKINELTCAYMFSQAYLQKNTHKKVFSLDEIWNICCVFLLIDCKYI
jgi:hypothetical protein